MTILNQKTKPLLARIFPCRIPKTENKSYASFILQYSDSHFMAVWHLKLSAIYTNLSLSLS